VLVLFAHPALEKSRVNVRLLHAARSTERITVHDLYEAYPEFDIDVREEQRRLVEHDVIVVQHPFYWYSTPALIKEWEDLVLEHGWAYGSGGTALHGKIWVSAITAGGSEASYCSEGTNCHAVRELLAPIEQTARLCGMDFLAPFVVHGTHALTRDDVDAHARDYGRLLVGLRDDTIDLELARRVGRINARMDEVVPTAAEG
jgi:glutathione-regulated potassium-efflux system ancillary protein KefG